MKNNDDFREFPFNLFPGSYHVHPSFKISDCNFFKRQENFLVDCYDYGRDAQFPLGCRQFVITALILQYGIGSGYVAIATTFGVIVMFDSMGVRRQSGEQGIVLIDAIKELTRLSLKFPKNEQELVAEEKDEKIYPEEMAVKKYLGHKPSEVFVGLLTGIFVTFIVRMFYEQI